MEYLSGMHALNISCDLDTSGDWHQSNYKWQNLEFYESESTLFKDYGIENNKKLPNGVVANVANHIRASLDLIVSKKFNLISGFKDDFICNSKYHNEIFCKIIMLKNQQNWDDINKFMTDEFMGEWIEFLKGETNE